MLVPYSDEATPALTQFKNADAIPRPPIIIKAIANRNFKNPISILLRVVASIFILPLLSIRPTDSEINMEKHNNK